MSNILKIQNKFDSEEKRRLIDEGLLDPNATIMAEEFNRVIKAVNILMEKQPITGLNYKNTVANYSDLPELAQLNDAYGVLEDGLIYIWNGLGFQSEGNGLDLSIKPTGKVKDGDNNSVSGGEVFETISEYAHVQNYINFSLESGTLNNSTGSHSVSNNWIKTSKIPCDASTIYTVDGLGTSTSTLSTQRFFFWNGTTYLGFEGAELSSKLTFETPENCTHFVILLEGSAGIGADIPNSIFWNTLKIVQGDEIHGNYIKAEKIKGVLNTQQILQIQSDISDHQEEIEQVSEKLNLIVETVFEAQTFPTTNGGINSLGAATNYTDYYRTTVTNAASLIQVQPSTHYLYTGIIERSNAVGILFLNEALGVIGTQFLIGEYTRESIVIPAGTKYMATSSYGAAPIIEIKRTELKNGKSVIYVNSAHTGEEFGSEMNPFKSITSAINSAKGPTTFLISEGDYRETLPLGNLTSGEYSFVVPRGHKVRVLGSIKLGGFSKTSGFDNIYEAAFTGTIINASRFGRIIYEDNNPSRLIADQHPLQKSTNYRLPFSVLVEKNNLSDVEDNPGTFFHDSENSKIYIHPSDSSDPTDNGYSYEVSIRNANTYPVPKTKKLLNISLEGLQFYFLNQGLTFRGFNLVTRKNITVMGVCGDGAFMDDTSNIVSSNDEAAFCNGDGINGHFGFFAGYDTLTDHRSMQPMAIYNDPWCHDNYDDGMSHHENHRVIVNGGLIEHNDDGGIRASNDSNYTVYNCTSRNNGLVTNLGEGFSVVNSLINNNRNGCKMTLFNCHSEGNAIGYASISSNNNQLEIINCISRNNGVELKCTHGKIISRNSIATNSNPSNIKVTTGSGTIVVHNDSLIE